MDLTILEVLQGIKSVNTKSIKILIFQHCRIPNPSNSKESDRVSDLHAEIEN